MTAPDIIRSLVDHFGSSRDQLVSASYNEMQIRREFIDPFFNALGWDIDNKQGAAEAYKDVIHEDAIKVGSATKAPDYSFRIGGTRKFFVEAKKPAVNVKEDVAPAFQLRRYAWSAKLPLSILTDFDELAVYDCRIKPDKTDKSSAARIKYLTYKDYIPHWEEIHSIFSRDAVWNGSFDKYVVGTKGKRGSDEVDDAFLKEIESWRDVLARNIALRNSKLSVRELNFAVQRTIDRIIFLRICEDRGIETYGALQALVNGERTYKRLCELFHRADERYNSGLFHFAEEKGRPESIDTLTLDLKIDDKPLQDIIAGLYYPDCPYEFSILPADILGQVYEQFLGKVIRLTAGHQAKVEEKPEVKKAGGVYYTPTYIVDYIVKNTVGRLVEAKTPKQVASLRILDPACGSGSFLIGAYQFLLDWHHTWYMKDSTAKWSTGKNGTLNAGPGGTWRLTTAERKRILLNNIYGVDIDSQAVEVTKLSLLLKVLEGENEETINQQLKMFHERALPDLGINIKCGNSLIGPDFFEGQLIVDPEERARINAFDWKTEFKSIMDAGGFDAVIGNPPYSAKQSIETQKLTVLYDTVEYKCDPYAFFLEQGLRKTKTDCYLGFIIPVTWMTNYYYMKLRKLLIDTKSLTKIALIDGLVFENANVDTCLVFLKKNAAHDEAFDWSRSLTTDLDSQVTRRPYSTIKSEERYDISPNADPVWQSLKERIDKLSVRLDEMCKISLGMKLRSNAEFVAPSRDKDHPDPIIFGSDISRYGRLSPKRYFCSAKAVIVGGTKNPVVQRAPVKIVIQAIRNLSLKRRIVGTLDSAGFHFVGTVNAVTIIQPAFDFHYLLGIINSTLINHYFAKRFTTISLTAAFLGVIPIRLLQMESLADKSLHDRMVELVKQMLQLHRDLPRAKTEHEKTALERQIDETDKQIDALVYELYGLTEDEIRIVEGDK